MNTIDLKFYPTVSKGLRFVITGNQVEIEIKNTIGNEGPALVVMTLDEFKTMISAINSSIDAMEVGE